MRFVIRKSLAGVRRRYEDAGDPSPPVMERLSAASKCQTCPGRPAERPDDWRWGGLVSGKITGFSQAGVEKELSVNNGVEAGGFLFYFILWGGVSMTGS